MTDDAAFCRLLEQLYGGLTHTPPWEDFLRALAIATDATFATLIIGRGHAGIDAHVTPDAPADRAQEYRHLAQADPFVGLPEGQVISFRDFVSHVPARFQAWMSVARMQQVVGVDLHRPPDAAIRLRVTRADDRADFGDIEKALIARLVPHLRIALDLHSRLTTTQAESQLFSSVMAGLAVASFILDRDGRILRCNTVGAQMLLDDSGIAERSGRLELRTRAASDAITRILASPPPPGEERLFEIATPSGPVLHARARAVPSAAYGDGAWLALFVADPTRPAAPTRETLRERFQLTPAEAALALQLMDGAPLADAASALAIAYNTARSHLRAIFAKTGTHRQIELVALLHTVANDFDVGLP